MGGAWGAQYQRTQPLATREGATGSNQRRRVAPRHLRRGPPVVEEIFATDTRCDASRLMRRRLAAYGHSWVVGAGASRPDRCLVDTAALLLEMTPINRGVGGTSSAQTAELIRRDGASGCLPDHDRAQRREAAWAQSGRARRLLPSVESRRRHMRCADDTRAGAARRAAAAR